MGTNIQYRFIVFFSLLIATNILYAYEDIPNLVSYDKQDYQAGRQNWDIDIDENGIVYFGNSEGLLYNVYGEWGLAKMSQGGRVRAVLADRDTVWCGGDEYGYFAKIEGELVYHSLGVLDGAQIWNICGVDNTIYFQSGNIIIQYNKADQTQQSLTLDEGIWSMTEWNGEMWFALRDGQVGILNDTLFQSVFQSDLFVHHEIRKLIVKNDEMYIVMYEGEVYRYDGQEIRKLNLPPALSNKTLFSGMFYDDDSYCLGTVSEGFLQIGIDGAVRKWVTSDDGLLDNTVLSMKRDALGNVWLGLDYGIAKIELQSAINTIFRGGATYSIKNFQGKTYLATNKGLFRASEDEKFEFAPSLGGQTWSLKEIEDKLFICHNKGLYQLKNGQVSKLVEFSGFLDIAHFSGTDYFLVSTYQGLILMYGKGQDFHYVDNLQLWGVSKLVWDEAHQCVWAEFLNKSVRQLKLNDDLSVSIEEYSEIFSVHKTGNGLFFSDNTEILEYSLGVFRKADHPLLDVVKGADIRALDFSPEGNSIAYIQDHEVKLFVLLPDGNTHSFNALLKALGKNTLADMEYLDLQNNILRLATDRGVTTFNLQYKSNYKKNSGPVISSLSVLNDERKQWFFPYPEEGIKFSSGKKDLKLHFSINKSTYDVVEFRYKLTPSNHHWSEWSSDELEVLLTQVKGGEYQFILQSRLNGGSEGQTSLHFTIEEVWYQTQWLILPIVLFILFVILIIVYIMTVSNRRKLKRQKKIYKQRDADKTLTMKNEQLLQYIEIISHKNMFLNKVKSGLEAMRNSDAQRWVNLISDEVNNEKKEFLFHKLFSEIHQDFISRLTDSFPELTSNDVRILSFIRINLDKNEISNLMNISQRSLDTNRYRLRKKLNLDRSADLNQFIRDF